MQSVEERKAYQKKWRTENKERLSIEKKIHYQNNKEVYLERAKIFIRSEKRKEWRKKNKEKSAKYGSDRWRSHGKYKKDHLKVYNMDAEDHALLMYIQNGACAICKTPEIELNTSLSVDHCHITNKIRGLLCNKCNRTLGLLEDNIDTINNLILYLQKDVQK